MRRTALPLSIVLALVALLAFDAHIAGAQPLRQATFELRNEIKIKVPDGAQRVRVWVALPQDNDPAQQVRDLKIDAPYAYRFERDSEGSRVLYLEAANPKDKELTIVETFGLTQREIRDQVDASKARPLTDADRARFAKYLEANKHVVIDSEIKRLADEIVGRETNPVLAARKLYDWVLENVDYWVKDPKNKKASPVGSTTYCLTFRTGNCTDFESLWASLARPGGSPPRSSTARSSSLISARRTRIRATTAGPSSTLRAWGGSTTTSPSPTSTTATSRSTPTTNGCSG